MVIVEEIISFRPILIQLRELLQIIILYITKWQDKTNVGIERELIHQLTKIAAYPAVILAVEHLVVVEDFHGVTIFRFYLKIFF